MPNASSFADSDLARYVFETDRRGDRKPTPRLDDGAMQLLRTPPTPRDKTLTSLAQAWRDSLPAGRRPDVMCAKYPRLANRVALCWNDPALTELLFKDLLSDRRGGRRGFPPDVHAELVNLNRANALRT